MTRPPTRTSGGVEYSDCNSPMPVLGSVVSTACGGTVQYCAGTPCVLLNGENIFFCMAVCKTDFESDPLHSCVPSHKLRSR